MFAGRLRADWATLEVEELGRTETREEMGIILTLTAPGPSNGPGGLTSGGEEEAGSSSGSSFTAPMMSPHSMHFVSSGGSLFKEQILHSAQNLDEWAVST